MAEQLILPVLLRTDAVFSNYVGPTLLTLPLYAAAQGKGEPFIFLFGKNGTGKTHLLQAMCQEVIAQQKRSVYLPLTELQAYTPHHVLQELEHVDVIALDDVDAVLDNEAWEEALFHLYNRARDAGARLVMTAHLPPNELKVTLPDLLSRLNAGLLLKTVSLSDDEKIQAFTARAKERGLDVPLDVSRFLLNHIPRNTAHLFDVLDRIDTASLQAQRRITIPFVKTVLMIE